MSPITEKQALEGVYLVLQFFLIVLIWGYGKEPQNQTGLLDRLLQSKSVLGWPGILVLHFGLELTIWTVLLFSWFIFFTLVLTKS